MTNFWKVLCDFCSLSFGLKILARCFRKYYKIWSLSLSSQSNCGGVGEKEGRRKSIKQYNTFYNTGITKFYGDKTTATNSALWELRKIRSLPCLWLYVIQISQLPVFIIILDISSYSFRYSKKWNLTNLI